MIGDGDGWQDRAVWSMREEREAIGLSVAAIAAAEFAAQQATRYAEHAREVPAEPLQLRHGRGETGGRGVVVLALPAALHWALLHMERALGEGRAVELQAGG